MNSWPVIYILSNENTKHLYVGETSDFYTRMTTHLRNADKKRLSTVHIAMCDNFNKSATLDIKSNLIKYISTDEYWELLNLNIGLSNHNYYQKSDKYQKLFNEIWEALTVESIPIIQLLIPTILTYSNILHLNPLTTSNIGDCLK